MKQTETTINRIIGHNLKKIRIMRGWTQEQLGQMLGISFQQIQKYETGVNNVSPGKLIVLANTLNVSISYFFNAPDITTPEAFSPKRNFLHLIQGLQQLEKQHPATFTAVCNMVTALTKAEAKQETELC